MAAIAAWIATVTWRIRGQLVVLSTRIVMLRFRRFRW